MSFELDPSQLEQANRIILGVSTFGVAQYLSGLNRLDRSLVGASFAVKMPKGTHIRVVNAAGDNGNGSYEYTNPIALALSAAEAGASQLIIDAKDGHEGKELEANIDDLLLNLDVEVVRETLKARQKLLERSSGFYDDIDESAVDRNYSRFTKLEKTLGTNKLVDIFPPNMVTVAISTYTDPEELVIVREHASSQGAKLIAVVGSSKKSLQQFKRYGQDTVEESTKLARIALDAEIWNIQTAAIDAYPLLNNLSQWFNADKIKIIGTGVFTGRYTTSDHKRSIKIGSSVGVDRFLIGEPVLLAENPNQAFMDHINAMPIPAQAV